MSGLTDQVYDEPVFLHAHMRPTFVTCKDVLDWRECDPDGVDFDQAEDFAKVVKNVAVESGCPNLLGAADSISVSGARSSGVPYRSVQRRPSSANILWPDDRPGFAAS